MTANHDLERRIADFYATEAPPRAPDWVLESALTTIDTTRQRRAFIRMPWRFQTMNTYAKLAVAAVVVIAIGGLGLAVLRPGTGPGPGPGGSGGPSPSPSASPSPTPRASISPSPSPSLPALTDTFRSSVHGISVSHPARWTTRPASEPWPSGEPINQETPHLDVIFEKETDSPFIGLASQPLGGADPAEWAAAAPSYVGAEGDCGPAAPVTIDGAAGVLFPGCVGIAAVTIGDRGYLIWLYRVDDEDWFRQILATVQLSPEDALDAAPIASPSGS